MSAVGKIVIFKGLKNHQQRTAALNNIYIFVKLKEQDAFHA